jgi:hypothetical protein
MRTLCLFAKPFGNKPRIIGEIIEDNGEYQFKYLTDCKLNV